MLRRRRRGDHHEAQFVADGLQPGGGRGIGVDDDLGVEPGADTAGLAQDFELAQHLVAYRFHVVPDRNIDVRVIVGEQAVEPFGGEYAELVAFTGHLLPDLVRGEAQDRRDPADQGLADQVLRGLAGAARARIGRGRVLAVLDHVEVVAAQRLGAEIVNFLNRDVKQVVAENLLQLVLQLQGFADDPAIEREHIVGGD